MNYSSSANDIICKVKTYGFTDVEIAHMIGVDSRAIRKWRENVIPHQRNMERLKLLLDIVDSLTDGPGKAARIFMSTPNSQLSDISPGEYLLKKGSAAREELILLAKNFAAGQAYSDTDYILLHVRLDLGILQGFGIDSFDMGEIINRDRRRIEEIMTGSSRASRPSQLEARQIRQAAAAAIYIQQYRSPRMIRKAMFEPGVNYRNKWMPEMATKPSIVQIIQSQREGDSRSYERATVELSQALKRFQK